ncbi:hypothetical protein BDR04DRAFT_1102974 [Suillus decipiens]|nr:hypothetical protein BDR04DRAFT_1102974 [Suillus decipiens]
MSLISTYPLKNLYPPSRYEFLLGMDVRMTSATWEFTCGLTFYNKLISRDSDQGMRTDFTCLYFSHLKRHLHPECIITQAVIEQGFLSGLSLSSYCPSHNDCLSRCSPY